MKRRLRTCLRRRGRQVEAVFGHGKTGHHLGKTFYRNQAMARIQQLTAATSMNLEKLVSARSPN